MTGRELWPDAAAWWALRDDPLTDWRTIAEQTELHPPDRRWPRYRTAGQVLDDYPHELTEDRAHELLRDEGHVRAYRLVLTTLELAQRAELRRAGRP